MVLQRWVFFEPIATLICSARFDAPQLFVAHQPRLQEPLQRFDIVLHFNALFSNCFSQMFDVFPVFRERRQPCNAVFHVRSEGEKKLYQRGKSLYTSLLVGAST